MSVRVRVLVLVLVLAPITPARASAQRLAWIEPAPGSDARVVAGEPLFVRVRLPTALTPPPGVQQREALEGWGGEIVARAVALDPAVPVEPRYALAVRDVRPDAGSSLVYRARVEIPPWIAPARYEMVLTTPGGVLRAVGLQVIEPGAVTTSAGAPKVEAPSARAKATGNTGLQVRYEDGALHLHVDEGAWGEDVLIGASGLVPIVTTGEQARWHPASASLGMRTRARAVVGVLHVAPGASVVLRQGKTRVQTSGLRVPSRVLRVGERVAFHVGSVTEDARVAWSIGDTEGGEIKRGWGGPTFAHVFTASGAARVHALVVSGDGVSAPLLETVRVRTAGPVGCGLTRGRSGKRPETMLEVLLFVAGLLKIRRRVRFGNRVASRPG